MEKYSNYASLDLNQRFKKLLQIFENLEESSSKVTVTPPYGPIRTVVYHHTNRRLNPYDVVEKTFILQTVTGFCSSSTLTLYYKSLRFNRTL